jgi:glycopeptide antibiotics resistance protein
MVVLALYHWAPFNFTFDHEMIRQRVAGLWVVPFRNYYFGTEFHAFTEICRKWMLAIPVGALLRLTFASSECRSRARLHHVIIFAIGLAVFTTVEAGQIFLPQRTADLTDVLVAMMGLETGRYLVDLLHRPGRAGMAASQYRYEAS